MKEVGRVQVYDEGCYIKLSLKDNMSAKAGLYVSRTCQKCARHGIVAGSLALWQNFADYDRIRMAYGNGFQQTRSLTRGVREGGYAGISDTTRRAKKKKKGACDAAAQVVIGVEVQLKDKRTTLLTRDSEQAGYLHE